LPKKHLSLRTTANPFSFDPSMPQFMKNWEFVLRWTATSYSRAWTDPGDGTF
jgi:hypothetical protein